MIELVVIICGLLSIAYGAWAIQSVMAADAGNARMQEIAEAIQEGASAYLNRQYTTIAIVGAVVFVLAWLLLSGTAAIGFALALLISFIYFGFTRAGQVLGHNGTLEPWLGAWIGNIVFFAAGIIMMFRVRK